MNLRRLKYFVKIVDVGSLTHAADLLEIAQPALSQQVANLEGELRQQLLLRTKRGVVPTEAGKVLYHHARQILRQCDQAVADMHGIQRALPPAVSIGLAPGTPASALALPLLRILRARLPELRPCLQEHHCAGLCEALLGGRLDLAVLPGGRTAVPGLQFQPLLAEPLCLVAAPSLAAPAETVPLRALAQWDLYLPATHDPLRKLVDEAFSRSGLTPRLVGEIDSPGTLAAVVGAGLGASIVAASRARELVLGGDAWQATITEPELDASLALCQSDHRPLSVAAQAVKDILLEVAAHAPGRRLAPPAGTSAAMGAATNPPH